MTAHTMQITVFGASGRVGRLVVALALEKGYRVVAFVHSRDPFTASDKLQVIKGDVSDKAAVEQAIAGSSAVISALGSWGTKDKNVLTSGMKTIVPAMEKSGVDRLVTLTGTGALWSGDTPNFLDRSSHALLGLVAPKILQDGEAHLRLLDASKLAWTCVRSPIMKDGDATGYHLDMKLPSMIATIPRVAVVRCLIDRIDSQDYLRQAPIIHRG